MNFYTIDYITSHQSMDSIIRVTLILALLSCGLVFSILYMRNRMRTRWRDVGIGPSFSRWSWWAFRQNSTCG